MDLYDDADLIRKAQGNELALDLLRAFSRATGPGELAAFFEHAPDGDALAERFEAYCERHPLPANGPRHDHRMGFLTDLVHDVLPSYAIPPECELGRHEQEVRASAAFRQAISRMSPYALVRAHRGEEPELERLRQFSCRGCLRFACQHHLGHDHSSAIQVSMHAQGGW